MTLKITGSTGTCEFSNTEYSDLVILKWKLNNSSMQEDGELDLDKVPGMKKSFIRITITGYVGTPFKLYTMSFEEQGIFPPSEYVTSTLTTSATTKSTSSSILFHSTSESRISSSSSHSLSSSSSIKSSFPANSLITTDPALPSSPSDPLNVIIITASITGAVILLFLLSVAFVYSRRNHGKEKLVIIPNVSNSVNLSHQRLYLSQQQSKSEMCYILNI